MRASICATNLTPEQLRDPARFRQDLLYRINTIEIRVPPLRERVDDIPLIAAHYVALYARKYSKPELPLGHAAIARLRQYPLARQRARAAGTRSSAW